MTTDSAIAGTALDPGLWSGKRRTRRVRIVIPVACSGTGSEIYPGRTIDLSRGGMLVGLAFAAIRTVADPTSIVELTLCVSALFPNGIDVQFLGRPFRVKAHVVRLVVDMKAPYPLLLGCRFDPILSESECAALGVPISQDETRPDGPRIADESNDVGMPGAARNPEPPVPATAPSPAKSPEIVPASPVAPSLAPTTVPDAPPTVVPTSPPRVRMLDVPPSPAATAPSRAASPDVPPAPAAPAAPAAPPPLRVATVDVPPVSTPPPIAAGHAVVAHLFPAWSQIGTRYSGRLASIHAKDAVVILTAPASETDAVGWAAGLGSKARVTLLKAGALIGDLRARVTRIDAAGPNEAKLTLALAAPFKSL